MTINEIDNVDILITPPLEVVKDNIYEIVNKLSEDDKNHIHYYLNILLKYITYLEQNNDSLRERNLAMRDLIEDYNNIIRIYTK